MNMNPTPAQNRFAMASIALLATLIIVGFFLPAIDTLCPLC